MTQGPLTFLELMKNSESGETTVHAPAGVTLWLTGGADTFVST
jgi:hypothetical protein